MLVCLTDREVIGALINIVLAAAVTALIITYTENWNKPR